jgi:septal ring factor EnvC (AmiA/AmiB activator)
VKGTWFVGCAMRRLACWLTMMLVFLLAPVVLAGAQKGDFLTGEEEDKLRQAQDPSDRVEAYIDLAQVRLDRLDQYRKEPKNSEYDVPPFLNKQLDEYLSLNAELRNWIDEQAERHGDMRRGLRKLLEIYAKQLGQLRGIQQAPGVYASAYAGSLQDAITDASDLLDGATKALSDQQTQFAESKEQEKAAARLSKERLKEEKKRNKEEKKLRKQEERKNAPTDPDLN